MGKENGFNAAELRQWIIEMVGKKPKVEKKVLFIEGIKNFGLTEEEKKDKSSGGKLVRCKSFIGSVLSEMLREGLIELVDEYFYKLPDNVTVIDLITEEKIEEFFLALMKTDRVWTKKTLFSNCEKEFDKNGDGAERVTIHRRGGNVLARLVKNGVILKEVGGKYSLAAGSRFPNTNVGNCLKDAADGADIIKCFKKVLNLKGGEFFESFAVNLIKKMLSRSATITKSDVTGGADDNGIDGVIEFNDALGFKERVLIQARTRSKGTINLKEVREFFGALISEHGSRGIFVTTTLFHSEATKFLNRHANLVGIDGDKLAKMAQEYKYGFKQTGNKIELDYNLFLDITEPI